jgi:hypothetical protein
VNWHTLLTIAGTAVFPYFTRRQVPASTEEAQLKEMTKHHVTVKNDKS